VKASRTRSNPVGTTAVRCSTRRQSENPDRTICRPTIRRCRTFNAELADVAGQLAPTRRPRRNAQGFADALADVTGFVTTQDKLASDVSGLTDIGNLLQGDRPRSRPAGRRAGAISDIQLALQPDRGHHRHTFGPLANPGPRPDDLLAPRRSRASVVGAGGGKPPNCGPLQQLFNALPKLPMADPVSGRPPPLHLRPRRPTLGGLLPTGTPR